MLRNTADGDLGAGRAMSKPDQGFDYHRYRKLLSEADDEPKRLALIDLLVDERARDKLAAHRSREIIRRVIGPQGLNADGERRG
jgi:hypothetical protein